MIDEVDTGIEMANHDAHEIGGSIEPSAIKFCGEEIGEAWPPMLEARAMAICCQLSFLWAYESKPTMRHFEKMDFGWSSSVMGLMSA